MVQNLAIFAAPKVAKKFIVIKKEEPQILNQHFIQKYGNSASRYILFISAIASSSIKHASVVASACQNGQFENRVHVDTTDSSSYQISNSCHFDSSLTDKTGKEKLDIKNELITYKNAQQFINHHLRRRSLLI